MFSYLKSLRILRWLYLNQLGRNDCETILRWLVGGCPAPCGQDERWGRRNDREGVGRRRGLGLGYSVVKVRTTDGICLIAAVADSLYLARALL